MRQLVRRPLLSYLLLAAVACASGGSGTSGRTSTRSDLLTLEDIQRAQWSNAYDMIQSMRPRWLQARGPDTLLGEQGEVQVYVDNTRLGGVATLRNLPIAGITSIQFFSPTEAAARWGLNHGQGAIYVSLRPR